MAKNRKGGGGSGIGGAASSVSSSGLVRRAGKKMTAEEPEDPRVEILPNRPANVGRVNGRQGASSRHRSHHSRHKSLDSDRDGWWVNRVMSLSALIGIVGFVVYYGYLGYKQTRVHTPLAADKVTFKSGLDVPDRFWGTYRPGVYFGMKHRSPVSLITGLMWLIPSTIQTEGPQLRHLCLQEDKLKRYGWVEHDGVNFGVQEIADKRLDIVTSFVKRQGGSHGGDWTARIELKPQVSTQDMRDETVLFFYVAKEGRVDGQMVPEFDSNGDLSAVRSTNTDLGNFVIRFINGSNALSVSSFSTKLRSLNDISTMTLQNLGIRSDTEKPLFVMNQKGAITDDPDIIIYMVHTKGKFSLDVVFESGSFFDRPGILSGEAYTQSLTHFRKEFQKKFESKFNLRDKGLNSTYIKFAQAAMSNMVGGIGYFYGHSKVLGPYQSVPVAYWNAGLYAAVPSRSFFPRGFLWDEGFHLLLVNKWNPEISVDIISHWLDLMNTEGWIPREQILGEEALSRVPEEFVVQRNDVANPPTLIMALLDLIERHRDWLLASHKTTLLKMWPRLQAWYNWLNRTQAGDEPTVYRWRGRNGTTLRELSPKTLASGLDDFPRASHPTTDERHLDLRCWMAMSSKLMAELADLLELDYDYSKYLDTYKILTDPELLDKLHWSEDYQSYLDYGYHSDNVVLQYPPHNQNSKNHHREKIRYTLTPPEYQFVNMFGYASLFPMSLQLLSPDSPRLLPILEKIQDPNELWTPYGLRSLSASAPLYQKRNTEHDPPYWRGAVWININFLTLKALKSYSTAPSPVGELAQQIHAKLRTNIMSNVVGEYYKTGYIWEQYDDSTGQGKGCRPFTGWSALVALIMAEEY
ncbi:unnamed protein product [Orchesella dallaii]|uniref:Mannosyl-oligosaccharide glucosidase n=1 Tax=Orchesella dallaii TaxID=48710 RepID=A0ABP1PUX3_9HEXA